MRCQIIQLVIGVNRPRDFQQREMKSLKLKMKVGAIQKSYDRGWVLFLVLYNTSSFSLTVLLWVFGLFWSHCLCFIHFELRILVPLSISCVYVCPVSMIFFPFPLSSFADVSANILTWLMS